MGRTETQFMADAKAAGYPLAQNRTVSWLTCHGHRNPSLQAIPARVIDSLHDLFNALGGDERRLQGKPAQPLRPDSFLYGQILELDEIQHFSTARLTALKLYPADTPLGFDIDEYQALCRRWRKGRRSLPKRQTDGRLSPCRRAHRAARLLHAVRDLLAPHAGAGPVIRIPAPECDPTIAVKRLNAYTGTGCRPTLGSLPHPRSSRDSPESAKNRTIWRL